MVETYSPSGGEHQLTRFLEKEMQALGYTVTVDRVGNVVGVMGQGSPTVLLCGHMDTVPQFLPVSLRDGVLYGRGTVDAKGPLAAMIMAGRHLRDEGFKGSLIVAAVVQEEGDNRGVKSLIQSGVEADYAVFGEPTGADTLTVAYKGSISMEVTCSTETGHSSAPWMYSSAIEKAMELNSEYKNLAASLSATPEGFDAVSTCLRRVEGGEDTGKVPDRCEMVIEFRLPPSTSLTELKEQVNSVTAGFREANPDVKVALSYREGMEPYMADTKSRLVRAFSRAIYQRKRSPVTLVRKAGSGDMNIYGNAFDVPVVTYGPGDPHLDHTDDEHIMLDEFLESIMVLRDAVQRLSP